MNVMNVIARNNMGMIPKLNRVEEMPRRKETIVIHSDGIDYNTIYRNHPGWYQKDSEAIKKAYEIEQEKAAGRIQKIVKKADTPNARNVCDSYEKAGIKEDINDNLSKNMANAEKTDIYDKDGAKIRNEIREKMYGKNYKKAAI